MTSAVKMEQITMRFGRVVANDHVDFEVIPGEILALVGENGAGKSTLMNILYGLYIPTDGTIQIHGQPVDFKSPVDAMDKGIGMVHQHFMLIPRFTVAENIVLGQEPRSRLCYDGKKAIEELRELCGQYEMNLDLNEKVMNISLGMQQRVEIIKALYRKAEIIIFDEPTAVLTPQEIDELGAMLTKLKKEGKTIIIITHKLQEVIDFSDRVTVLRQGKIVGTVTTKDSNPEEITMMMVGHQVQLGGEKQPVKADREILSVENLNYCRNGRKKLDDVSFTVNEGEIFGIAGIDNSGQRELTEILAGVNRPDSGRVLFEGKDLKAERVPSRKRMGIGFIPQDRHKHGLVLSSTIKDNLILGYQRQKAYCKKRFFRNRDEIAKAAAKKIEEFDIRPADAELLAGTLSGGNQQKIIIAREAGGTKRLVIADQPSRGVDIGAIELIHKTLVEIRNSGNAVVLVSLELDEVMLLSDRIAVMYEGKLMGILDGKTATREQIGLMMTGAAGGVENETEKVK